jgi:hypothetical protein
VSSRSILAGRHRDRPAIPVDDLEPGMILDEDVHDAQGRLLMPKGTVLTDRHLRAFQLWGILAVGIRGPEGEEPPAPRISPELLAQAEALIRPRFRNNDPAHPLIAVLIVTCTLREARRLAETARVDA